MRGKLNRAGAALALGLALLAAMARAQSAPPDVRSEALVDGQPAKPTAKAPVADVIAGGDSAVDESALRYYASLRQTARVEAEIRRLKHFHPGWNIPSDLYSVQQAGGIEETPLWALFSADKLVELRAAIAAKRAADRAWRPSDDLVRKLRGKEVRLAILDAYRARHWRAAVDIAEADAKSIDIRDVELRWDIAQAYKEINRTNKAFELLYSILATSRDPEQRVATALKAINLLPMADAEKLIGMGQTTADGRNEFDGIAIDITRARISAYLHDESVREVAAGELEALQTAARAAEDPSQPGLVAWYSYKRGDLHEALEWFKTSLGHGGDAMIAHGLAHTLRRLGMLREAEEVSYAWREPLVNNAILFIDLLERDLTAKTPPYIEPTRLSRYAQVTMAAQSGEGAQALAWYAYNSCQFETALDWFKRANAWLPKEATAYGYALTLRRLKKQREFLEVANRYDGLFPLVVEMLFPDGRVHAPTRCDPQPAGRRPAEIEDASVEVRAPTGLRYLGDPPSSPALKAGGSTAGKNATAYAVVPRPDGTMSGAATMRMPVLRRDEFPIAVRAENDLRFGADGTSVRGDEVADAALAHERPPVVPLTARRVPGVGTMPYEKFGFALLPAWNGAAEASDPPASMLPPAAGTAWARETGSDATGTIQPGAVAPKPGSSTQGPDSRPEKAQPRQLDP